MCWRAYDEGVKVRLVIAVLAICLVTVLGVRPCVALMQQPAHEDHECCDHPDQHKHDQRTECESICALAQSPFLSENKSSIERHDDWVVVVSSGPDVPVISIASQSLDVDLAKVSHSPPIYLLHAALLL